LPRNFPQGRCQAVGKPQGRLICFTMFHVNQQLGRSLIYKGILEWKRGNRKSRMTDRTDSH